MFRSKSENYSSCEEKQILRRVSIKCHGYRIVVNFEMSILGYT